MQVSALTSSNTIQSKYSDDKVTKQEVKLSMQEIHINILKKDMTLFLWTHSKTYLKFLYPFAESTQGKNMSLCTIILSAENI